jgi:hypothetical protein
VVLASRPGLVRLRVRHHQGDLNLAPAVRTAQYCSTRVCVPSLSTSSLTLQNRVACLEHITTGLSAGITAPPGTTICRTKWFGGSKRLMQEPPRPDFGEGRSKWNLTSEPNNSIRHAAKGDHVNYDPFRRHKRAACLQGPKVRLIQTIRDEYGGIRPAFEYLPFPDRIPFATALGTTSGHSKERKSCWFSV